MQNHDNKPVIMSLRKSGSERKEVKPLARFAEKNRSEQRSDVSERGERRSFNRSRSGRRAADFTAVRRASFKEQSAQQIEREDRQIIDLNKVFPCETPVGRMVELVSVSLNEQGAMFDAHEHGQVFIPKSQLPESFKEGDKLKLFLYADDGRIIATAKRPYIELGQTARLKVNAVRGGTAWLELGIPKDLAVPVSEQRGEFRVGDEVPVLMAIDDLGRLYGTQCFNRYIRDRAESGEFTSGDRVKVVPLSRTPLGYRVIVNDSVYGLIFSSEQHGSLTVGRRCEGFIRNVRPDGRIDVSLQKSGREAVSDAAADILQALGFSGGFIEFCDSTPAEIIEEYLHMSKGRFKKAAGLLYKERLIEIEDKGLRLTEAGRKEFEQRFSE